MDLPNEKKVVVRDIMPNASSGIPANNPVEEPIKPFFKFASTAHFLRAGFWGRKREPMDPITDDLPPSFRPSGWRRTMYPWKAALVSVGLVAVAAFFIQAFSKTVIIVVPHSEHAAVDMAVPAGGSTDVGIDAVSAEESLSMRGKSSGMEEISERATGHILIYNAHSTDSQALVRRTRFETADGKVYRLAEATTVPGATVVDGKIQPSVIEVAVIADQPGDASNIGMADFTIPGFKGGAKYEKFYAKSKTSMTGGFVGRAAVIREDDVAAATQTIERDLRTTLMTRLHERLPEGLMIPSDAITYSMATASVEPAAGARGDAFEVRITGTATALAIRRAEIERLVVDRYGKAMGSGSPEIRNFDALAIRATAADSGKETMTVSVKGDAELVWGVPGDELKKGLAAAAGVAGRNAVFASYPQIKQVRISYSPSWWRIFTHSEEKIVVREDLGFSE